MASSTPSGGTPYYFVPAPAEFPVQVAFGMLLIVFGGAQWLNGQDWGAYVLLVGVLIWIAVVFRWFRQAIGESEGHLYSLRVDASYRWSMSWFIFSEVMFFGAFFGALYWARVHSVPDLGDLQSQILWPDFKGVWPTVGGGTASPTNTVEPFSVNEEGKKR